MKVGELLLSSSPNGNRPACARGGNSEDKALMLQLL